MEYLYQLLTGGVRVARLLWTELLLSGDPITAFLTLVGLGVWAMAFGAGGYITIRAAVAAVVSGL